MENESEFKDQKREIERNKDLSLREEIYRNQETGELTYTELTTDEKVLARVTDGIYRQPASAIRELISNAYDADAENVSIDTDVPRFTNISVKDDGNGMSVSELTNLIHHIGGSAKRDPENQDVNVSSNENPSVSPNKKRKLIGKIGIGLFSVAQLTREFYITTKRKGDHYYLQAHVILHNYSDHQPDSAQERGQSFSSGRVAIKSVKTKNEKDHGTSIYLKNIKESARKQLMSEDVWSLYRQERDASSNSGVSNKKAKVKIPNFHIGSIQKDNQNIDIFDENSSMPWCIADRPETRFSRLFEAIMKLSGNTSSPKIEEVLDNYLRMLWMVGLSVPVEYLYKHPFSLGPESFDTVYKIENDPEASQATAFSLKEEETIASKVLGTPSPQSDKFNVTIDDVKIYRPIKFTGLPTTKAIVKEPLLFVGSYKNEFSHRKITQSGGPLSFKGYILWCPKVIPREHNGVLVRIHDSSGTLFDETFMKYQIAEHTIKSQLVAEIFVEEGLESALNIDRESFNVAHPHWQIVSKWLHSALRQTINTYKAIKREAHKKSRNERNDLFRSALEDTVQEIAEKQGYEADEYKSFFIEESGDIRPDDAYCIAFEAIKDSLPDSYKKKDKAQNAKAKLEAIMGVLDIYGLVEELGDERFVDLIGDLAKVIFNERQ